MLINLTYCLIHMIKRVCKSVGMNWQLVNVRSAWLHTTLENYILKLCKKANQKNHVLTKVTCGGRKLTYTFFSISFFLHFISFLFYLFVFYFSSFFIFVFFLSFLFLFSFSYFSESFFSFHPFFIHFISFHFFWNETYFL